jgi:23S rRNA pseudouridine1911/1915/1917 synthase
MDIKIIYEDNDVLVVDKPTGIVVFPEGESLKSGEKTLIDCLTEKYPELKNVGEAPRYGIVHRLDKDTSGVLLVAKTNEALIFLQNQFINRKVEKKYVCLAEGVVKDEEGEIKTLIARAKNDFRKQRAFLPSALPAGRQAKSAREAITEYKVLERFKDYTLLEVEIKTGRRHQIRCHLSYLKHPIAGDKLYSFKNSKIPEGLARQFLHAQKLKIQLSDGKIHEFVSELPEDLKQVIKNLAR